MQAADYMSDGSAETRDVPAIETVGLTKRYGSGEDAVIAVDKLHLSVHAGEVFGFLGPNGAGKSTTIDMILDYIRPSEGHASVLGRHPQRDAERLRHEIGVVPEGFGLYERLTGRRHLEFAIEWKSAEDEPADLLARVGLDHDDANRPVQEYSKGMRQRLILAMALVGGPSLLILDEPSSGLDPHGIRMMRDIVRKEAARGTTVFFSSHILEQVEAVCDRVGILANGRLVNVDTVDGLRQAIGRESTVKLHIPSPVEVDPTVVTGVDSAYWVDSQLHVTCTDPQAKARVITRLTTQGVDIADIEVESPSLEDVFTAYTDTNETVDEMFNHAGGVNP